MDISIEELAREVTNKIRQELEMLKFVAFGEIVDVTPGANGSYRATVILSGSTDPTIPLDVLGDYIPAPGHWVMMVYPQSKNQDGNREKPLPVILHQLKGAS